jgi:hypothetical protein
MTYSPHRGDHERFMRIDMLLRLWKESGRSLGEWALVQVKCRLVWCKTNAVNGER